LLGTVIVGASHSGITLSDLLRKGGYDKNITIIDQSKDLPVERPPLSKFFLSSRKSEVGKDILMRPLNWYQKNNISLRMGIEVMKISPSQKVLHLSDQTEIKYENLVIANGASPRLLNKEITKSKKIKVLRNLKDALDIKSELYKPRNISIIGGGYIGLELASSLKKTGHNIKVIEMSNRLLSRVASPELSSFFKKLHLKNGVEIFCDEILKKIEFSNSNYILKTNKQVTSSEIIIVGIGVTANTSLAKSAGLECEDGIIVNSNYLTNGENIFAIGDCAINNDEYGVRIESVHNAQFSAMRVSSFILGKPSPELEVPWFWSDQFDVKLQSVGIYKKNSKTISRNGKRDGAISWWSFDGEKLISVEAVNDPQAFMIGKQIMQKKIKINADQFKSNNNLKELIR